MKNTEIEVSERLMDYWTDDAGLRHPKYHAQIKGLPGRWGSGKSWDEAVGDLIRSHPEQFGVTVAYLGKQDR